MRLGVGIPPTITSWQTVQQAEELGFASAWLYDSQMLYTDVFVAMALAAEHTRSIRLGTGVLVASNRIAPVAAGCFASLNRLAPGRIDFGVGTGYTARRAMGQQAQRWSDVADYARVVRSLVRGETVNWRAEGADLAVRFLEPDGDVINTTDPVPLHVSAFGPKGRALTAEMADGWITLTFHVGSAIRQNQLMSEDCRALGRDPASLRRTIFVVGCVLQDGEAANSPRAVAEAGPAAAVVFHELMEKGTPPPPWLQAPALAYRELYEAMGPPGSRHLTLHRGHFFRVRDDEVPFLTDEVMRRTTFTGTPAELLERLRTLRDAGFDELVVQVFPGQDGALLDWARLFERV